MLDLYKRTAQGGSVMTRARRELISLDETPFYHCTTRCVRRAFLCGNDSATGQCYEHRRGWIVRRIKQLTSMFAIDIAAYAVMSNHYHLVLRVDREAAMRWSRDEVIQRWRQLFRGPALVQRYCSGTALTKAEMTVVDEVVEQWRERLMDISWFMRCLNEYIARKANAEDRCKGRFWESRFTSQALLDEQALLACMVYVDLNPIRASMADRPESSDFTSIQERLGITPAAHPGDECNDDESPQDPLMAFAGAISNRTPDHHLPYSFVEYLELLDWTGRAVRDDKRGHISADLPPILHRLEFGAEQWLKTATSIERRFFSAIGPVAKLEQLCARLGKRWLHGTSACRQLFPLRA